MTEPKLDFQTWICPICFDDHKQPTWDELHSFCSLKDLKKMREEITKLKKEIEEKNNILRHSEGVLYFIYGHLKRDSDELKSKLVEIRKLKIVHFENGGS